MPCNYPVKCSIALNRVTDEGKRHIVYGVHRHHEEYLDTYIPCGRCLGCRIEKSRETALRCVHEADTHDQNCFITLTISDQSLAEMGPDLNKAHFQDFIKRLRKWIYDHKMPASLKAKAKRGQGDILAQARKEWWQRNGVRYYQCGEYGELTDRPHYHACLFNFDFEDKVLWSVRNGIRTYKSGTLDKLWSVPEKNTLHYNQYPTEFHYKDGRGQLRRVIGFTEVGQVTWQSAAYVARYVLKKKYGESAIEDEVVVDEVTGDVRFRQPPYVQSSTKPGIGYKWFENYGSDCYPKDYVTHEGQRYAIPRYYDRIADRMNYDIEDIKRERMKKLSELETNKLEPERLHTRNQILVNKIRKLRRDKI